MVPLIKNSDLKNHKKPSNTVSLTNYKASKNVSPYPPPFIPKLLPFFLRGRVGQCREHAPHRQASAESIHHTLPMVTYATE